MTQSIFQGYLQIYTGTGKGKTTAALGLALRAHGRGKKVGIIFFDKGAFSGERESLEKLEIPFWVTGLNRVIEEPSENHKMGVFRFGVNEEDQKEGQRGLEIFRKLLQEEYDMIILDEINSTIDYGMVDKNAFLNMIKKEWNHACELICTGRNACEELMEMADLVTEMVPVKHYFQKKVPAREGIEF